MKLLFNKIKSSLSNKKNIVKEDNSPKKNDEFKFTHISNNERLTNRCDKYQFIIK